ncbi:PAS domain S-box protein [Oculatella sp. FACHB-28]|uniref:PAS domain S-box protein n=1 Tax=Oculatella sp. FACHB-28 TaxID=2692845 RepID=UPI001689A0C0|nr:PAS domain S-box protein [Oculatella sp. FACHB-28]MBD2054603.1 PAS domain S-box protein [Oculatella sp. FACHB-28]
MRCEADPVELERVLITEELLRRTSRTPALEAENKALRTLARHLSQSSQTLLNELVTLAKDFCQAGTAGVSLLEVTASGEEVFRWVALAGALNQYQGETTPVNFSPCGVCLEQGTPQLYFYPERYFTYLQQTQPAIVEELVIPLLAEDRPLGTLWIVSHEHERHFDAEDVRLMTSLADFATAALQSSCARQIAEATIIEQKRNEAQRRQAEAALRVSEAQARLAIKVGQLGTWHYDPNTNLVELDERMRKIWGEPEDAVTIPLPKVIERIHPDDQERVAAAVGAALNPRSSGTYDIDYRIVWDDGTERWVSANGQAQFEGEGEARHPVGFLGTALDITDRKQAEVALAAQEQRYRHIFETVSVSIWEEDFSQVKAAIDQLKAAGVEDFHQYFVEHPEFVQQAASKVHLRDVNQASLQMFGAQDKAELLSSLEQIFVPETQEAFAGELLAIATEAPFFTTETVLRTLHGNRFDVWVTITFPPKAEPYDRVLVSLLNISERKHTEAALRNSAERLSVALTAAKLGDWSWDAATDLVTFSDQAATIFGIPPGPHLTWGQIQTLLHEDDQERARLQVEQAIVEQSDYDIEYRVIQPGGSERWVAAKGRAQYGASEQVIGMLGVVQDITERKQTEQEREHLLARVQSANQTLQRFIEHTPTAVVMLDQEMRYLFASRQWMREYAPTYSDLRGLSHYEVMSDTPDRWREVHQRCLAGATERCEEDYYVRADGSSHWLHWEILPWYDSEGAIGGIILFAENITERKQASQEREHLLEREREAREAAETANRVKDEFLAVLSHELRSPLNPILGWSKLLQTRKLDAAKTTEALKVIERNAKLQSELIEDLLDISRILSGKLSLNVGSVDLTATIQAAMETVRLAAETKSIEIRTAFALDAGQVWGDASRLQQVVWNLLSNAVKFTPPGGRVEIGLQRLGTHAQIVIRDTGKGISPNFLPYVFDYFRQADSATTRQFGGLGLGLAIVHHLVELHGGTVQADSAGEGQGATFTVKLPIMISQSLANQDSAPIEQSLELNGIKVLVVDDDTDTREFVAFLLEQAGASVIAIASAGEVLTVLPQFKPDVLLSDIGMPDMDGYMLLQQIRTLSPEMGGQTPAIALTAYAGEIDYQKALSAGFQRHLAKPIEPEEVIRTIMSLRMTHTLLTKETG